MVRRRERWQNLAWLQWMEDDTGEGLVTTVFAAPYPVGASLNTLTSDFRRFVDMERDGETFRVRVMPRNPDVEYGSLALGMAYSGTNLRNILTTAVVECDMISNGTIGYRSGAGEKWRWVS